MAQADDRIKIEARLIEACYDDTRQVAAVIYQLKAHVGDTDHIRLFNAEHPVGESDARIVLDAMSALYGREPGHGWN